MKERRGRIRESKETLEVSGWDERVGGGHSRATNIKRTGLGVTNGREQKNQREKIIKKGIKKRK